MTFEQAMKLAQKTDFLMGCQERTGVCFDVEKAKKLYEFCCDEMLRIEGEVEPHLPKKQLNKGELAKVTPPKIQFKNSKEGLVPSKHCENFFDVVIKKKDEWYGVFHNQLTTFKLPYHEPVVTEGNMLLKHQKDMKEWLMKEG